jgi:D-glycero-D-manno-heptose 1,7-bisphosphate phosphatase
LTHGPCKLVVLDRDGVINVDSDRYIKSPDEWVAIPGSLGAIARLHAHGFGIVVVSNQSGIGRGLFSEATLAAIHSKMRAAIEGAGGAIDGIYYCPHRPDEGCRCRKPSPGLLEQIETDFGCSLENTPFIGDKLTDVEAAVAVGARPILVSTGDGAGAAAEVAGRTLGRDRVEVYADLAEAAARLIAE